MVYSKNSILTRFLVLQGKCLDMFLCMTNERLNDADREFPHINDAQCPHLTSSFHPWDLRLVPPAAVWQRLTAVHKLLRLVCVSWWIAADGLKHPSCPLAAQRGLAHILDTLHFSTGELVNGMVGSRLQKHDHIQAGWLLPLFQLF